MSSRWRFLLALAAVLGLAAIGVFGPDVEVGVVTLDSTLFALGGLVVLAYVVLEARDGYRERRPT